MSEIMIVIKIITGLKVGGTITQTVKGEMRKCTTYAFVLILQTIEIPKQSNEVQHI